MKIRQQVLVLACWLLAAAQTPAVAGDSPDNPTYFDYDEFQQVVALDPKLASARLCGLTKDCMRLWKEGELLVREGAMVVHGDFDGDGTPDIGIALEKDHDAEGTLQDYFELVASKRKDGWHLMETVPIAGTHPIVETTWDDHRKRINIDTGERQLVSQSAVTMMSDGKILGGFRHRSGEAEILLTYLQWNPENKRFKITHGTAKE